MARVRKAGNTGKKGEGALKRKANNQRAKALAANAKGGGGVNKAGKGIKKKKKTKGVGVGNVQTGVKVKAAKGKLAVAAAKSKVKGGRPVKKKGIFEVKGNDARLKLIKKQMGEITDARDILAYKARGTDARDKLKQIRNLKQGKLDEKTTQNGGITITTTTKGKVLLTTKRKELQKAKAKKDNKRPMAGMNAQPGGGPRTPVGRGGARSQQMQQQTRSAPGRIRGGGVDKHLRRPNQPQQQQQQRGSPHRRMRNPLESAAVRRMSEADVMDEELMNSRVDPAMMRRTLNKQKAQRRRSSPTSGAAGMRYVPTRTLPGPSGAPSSRYNRHHNAPPPPRSPSPLRYEDRQSFNRPGRQDRFEGRFEGRFDSGAPALSSHVSPLQGAKIVVANLQTSVTQEDIIELFGDVGALKRAKIVGHGQGEVVFVKRSDAVRAVEIYHNRQLDGKPMKCSVVQER